MSRLAAKPIEIPNGVTVDLKDGSMTVRGPKGELQRNFKDLITISIDGNEITLTKAVDTQQTKALWGTYASHIRNMIAGVTEGFKKTLLVEGVGFRWTVSGANLEMTLGFSHPVIMPIPDGLKVEAEKNKLTVEGIDKELVGMFAANIRAKKKPEPYKGKGIRYEGEIIRRKQGKKSA
jgi:large subunit ribosomal protein L6